MATDLATPSNTLAKIRWHEQYVSEGVNKKFNGIAPHGVIRGGRLGTSLLNDTVTVEADPDTNDSIYSAIDANGHQVTFRQYGDVALNLSALAGSTVYIGLEVVYVVSADTTVKWRAFSQAEVDADASLVVLGSVDVPGVSAIIPESDIYYDRRRDAGWNLSAGMRDWRQIVVNPSFEGRAVSINDDTEELRDFPFWEMRIFSSPASWRVLSPGSGPASQPHTGYNNLIANGGGVGAHSMTATPVVSPRVTPGQVVKSSVWVRGDAVTLGSGAGASVGMVFIFYDWDGNLVTSYQYVEDGTVVTGTFDWFEISATFKVPATTCIMMAYLWVADPASFAGDIGFDDFQIWLEPGRVHMPEDRRVDVIGNEVTASGLIVTPSPAQAASVLGDIDPSDIAQRALRLMCKDPNQTSLEHEWRMVSDAIVSWIMSLPQGKLHIGKNLAGSTNNAIKERLKTWFYNTDGHYSLMWEMDGDGGTSARGKIRIYVAEGAPVSGNQMVVCITHNAEYDPALNAGAGGWTRDVFGSSYRFDIGRGDLVYYGYSQTDPDGWTDFDWDGPGLECFDLDTNLSSGDVDTYLPGGISADCNYRFRSARYGNYLYFNGSALLPSTSLSAPINPDWSRSIMARAYPEVAASGALYLDLSAWLKDGDWIEDLWIWSLYSSGTAFDWELREKALADPAGAPSDTLLDSGTTTSGGSFQLDKWSLGEPVDKSWGSLMNALYLLIWTPTTLGSNNYIDAVGIRYSTQKTYV